MTNKYTIRPLTYSNFTNREFESLMIDTYKILENFTEAQKDEDMYAKHLGTFKSNLEEFQNQLASVEKKESTSLTMVDKERDSALVGLSIGDLLRLRRPNSRKPMRHLDLSLLCIRILLSIVTMLKRLKSRVFSKHSAKNPIRRQ